MCTMWPGGVHGGHDDCRICHVLRLEPSYGERSSVVGLPSFARLPLAGGHESEHQCLPAPQEDNQLVCSRDRTGRQGGWASFGL